ncbi:MAG: alpha-amylase family glycosyl hydrolase [bacterium]
MMKATFMIPRHFVTCLFLFLSLPVFGKEPPEWVQGAVWYQILPERFRNINPANDPIKERVVGKKVDDWQVHPWASDWYKLQVWEQERDLPFPDLVNNRRYGGDLIGVIEKLPYLKDLGIHVLYLTPVFESPSVEKYDISTLHHIDNNFGLNRKEDWQKILSEKEDPASWTLTSSDEMFIELITQAHELEIKVVIEAVFNFCGRGFWAFRDLEENQQNSKYKEWFEVTSWDDPMTPDTVEFDYTCWRGDRGRPLFKKDEHGLLAAPIQKYIFDITKRWMDPNDDGDPVDGIDGWFINHVEDLPGQFWREWNDFVKSLNANAVTISEQRSDRDGFDLWMHHEYSRLLRDFFVIKHDKMTVTQFCQNLHSIRDRLPDKLELSLISQLSSHRTERIASTIVNAKPSVAAGSSAKNGHYGYDPVKPDTAHRKVQKLLTIFQLTYPSAPAIFFGDESGMWGGAYPDNIKPMLWKEFVYERETYKTVSPELKAVSDNGFDQEIFDVYRRLNQVRLRNPALTVGEYYEHLVDDERRLLVYSRRHKKAEVIVFLNFSEKKQSVELTPGWKKNLKVKDPFGVKKYRLDKFDIKLELAPMSGRVLVKEK